MNSVLYIPGFRETYTKRDPGFCLEEYCKEINTHFRRLIHPGDINSGDKGMFSMSELENRVYSEISAISSRVKIICYSLSALPTLKAVERVLDEAHSIESLIFLNPADDPLHSLRIRKWLYEGGKNGINNREDFVSGKDASIFDALIGDWNGDRERFISDLRYFDNKSHFYSTIDDIRRVEKIPIVVYRNPDDVITNGQLPNGNGNRELLRVGKSHIPALNGEEIYNLAA